MQSYSAAVALRPFLLFMCVQMDGGMTFTEPTAIINGNVEGAEEVTGQRYTIHLAGVVAA